MARGLTMRNITRGLQQRLDELQAERAQIVRRLERLAEKESLLQSVLGQEHLREHTYEDGPAPSAARKG